MGCLPVEEEGSLAPTLGPLVAWAWAAGQGPGCLCWELGKGRLGPQAMPASRPPKAPSQRPKDSKLELLAVGVKLGWCSEVTQVTLSW